MAPRYILSGRISPRQLFTPDMPNAKFGFLEAGGCVWAGLGMYQGAYWHLTMCFKRSKRLYLIILGGTLFVLSVKYAPVNFSLPTCQIRSLGS